MPTPTDLVTDLPADFEVFGQAVDTSMADLRGGTTGQILSKTTNADMDFTWIANDQGDITNIAVTSPITGGGSSGSVTIGVDAATTSAAGVVQLSDSTSTTSSVLASTPTATKAAYDLANTASTTATAAIPKSTVTTAGDVIYATGSAAVTRLGIGTANQVLAVNSGATAPEWKTISSGTFPVQRSANVAATFTTTSATWVDVTGYTLTFTPVSATNKITIGIDFSYTVGTTGANVEWRILRGGTAIFYRASSWNSSGLYGIQHFEVTDTNVAASSQTYKLQVQINGGFTYTNYNETIGFTGSQIRSLEVY